MLTEVPAWLRRSQWVPGAPPSLTYCCKDFASSGRDEGSLSWRAFTAISVERTYAGPWKEAFSLAEGRKEKKQKRAGEGVRTGYSGWT